MSCEVSVIECSTVMNMKTSKEISADTFIKFSIKNSFKQNFWGKNCQENVYLSISLEISTQTSVAVFM